jgi:NAD(P)-dependent dehydrogenase (short-subunit alcohol dehydrogenase family)
MGKLDGKVVVITGGSSGIGLATAQRFVAEGAYVFITGRRQAELEKAAKLVGRNVTAVQGDIANLSDIDRLYETVKKQKGVLHVVVANAAFVELAQPSLASVEHFDKTFDVNARGTFFTIQRAVPLMTAGGSIVTVGSIAYKKGIPPMTVYSSTKAAIRYSVKGWAAELIGKGIRVNNLSPGVIDTPIIDGQHKTKEEADVARYEFIRRTPMGRLGRPEEMAAAIFYLASDESSFTTGIDLVADGGLSEF